MAYTYGYAAEDLYVEQGTDRVPDDGQYHIVLKGEVVDSQRNVKRALARLQEVRRDLAAGHVIQAPDARTQMMKDEETQRFLRQSSYEKFANRTRKGGKGR